MRCTECHATLTAHARFCHNCGTKVVGKPADCPSCGTTNPPNAKYCMSCACALENNLDFADGSYLARFSLDFENMGQLSDQIEVHFFNTLKKRISEEHQADKYPDYLTAFYDSHFNQRFKAKAQQLAEEAYTLHLRQDETVESSIDQLLDNHFEALMDHFIIMHARHLNEVELPEAILKYQGKKRDEVQMEAMVLDYLDIDAEKNERFYRDFLAVPAHKMKNAAQSFLFAEPKEMVYLLADQTVFGSCKEGFAITERGLYWKAHFNKPYAVHYGNLQEIRREKGWITINGRYFHVNPSLDFKVMKLLKKLKRMF